MNIDKKICRTCGEEKGIEEYYKFHHDCKGCVSIRNKNKSQLEIKKRRSRHREIYRQKQEAKRLGVEYIVQREMTTGKECNVCKNFKDISEYNKRSGKCKKCQKEYSKKWRHENRIQLKKKKAEYYQKNRKDIDKKNKIHRIIYIKKQLKNPTYKLNKNISESIRVCLRGNKSGQSWEKLVGYTIEDLKKRLESLWEPWMNWENYGNPNGDHTNCWHIDHIIPKSWFKFKTVNDEEFRLCWSLRNLQPKEGRVNVSKQNRFIG